MGRKGIVTSIFSRLVDTTSSPASSPGGGGQVSPPWPWPSCGNNPRTSSFRAGHEEEPCCTSAATVTGSHAAATARIQLRGAAAGDMYKTVNSVYFDAAEDEFSSLDGGEEVLDKEVVGDDESCFSAMTTASEEWSEAVVRSLGRSTSTNRFFFDPGPPSNSILPAAATSASTATTTTTPPAEPAPDPEDGTKQPCASKPSSLAEGSVAVAVDSADPHADFRASMEEMVAAHGLRNWADLEELLSWYLRVNDKHNHPLIVGAFVDLLINLASSTTATTTTSASSSTGKSAESSTTTSTTGVTTTTTASTTAKTAATAARRRGGGASNDAPCSSSSSSCGTPDDSLVDVAEKASSGPGGDDDDHVRCECEHHQC